eukprot:5480831-Pyramimonas_sp.AAC.1
MAQPAYGRHSRFRAPPTRFVAPRGAPPRAPPAQAACGRCPIGSSTADRTRNCGIRNCIWL